MVGAVPLVAMVEDMGVVVAVEVDTLMDQCKYLRVLLVEIMVMQELYYAH
jgi:hypothetical protein